MIILNHFSWLNILYVREKQILHLTGPRHIQNTIDRKKGYRDALAKFHIPYDSRYAIESGVSVDDGANAIEKVLSLGIPFNAVFCFTETQALGAKRTLQEHNIVIPSEVAICCMSGTALSTLVHPPLTAVEQKSMKWLQLLSVLFLKRSTIFQFPIRPSPWNLISLSGNQRLSNLHR